MVQRDKVLLKSQREGGKIHAQNLVHVGGMDTKEERVNVLFSETAGQRVLWYQFSGAFPF